LKNICEVLDLPLSDVMLVSSETKQGIDKVHQIIEQYL
jgi:hypothetical protein